ncbi:sensor histidine kinase [Labrys sp. La1]|uniref:sensor histidine kinase n=1 Tax=Labrys sp. La1 TaxID=3404917 RepID=UPI003EB7A8B0
MSPVAEDLGQLGHLLATDTLAVIAAIALMSWLLRRRENVLAWLCCAGVAWCLFNLEGLAEIEARPFGLPVNRIALLYPLLFTTLGLAASLVGASLPRGLVVVMALGCLGLGAAAFPFHGLEIMRIAGLATIGVSLLILGFFATRAEAQIGAPEKLALVILYALGLGAVGFDLYAGTIRSGHGTRLAPYAGVVLLGFSGFVILRHILANAEARERLNQTLGQRIETTKANLLASESARHALEIAHAVKLERERLMREIHDGIGSSLVAALASAERQGKESTTAVVALKGALTDLRVAVDSLEPVEGNVATLLASLRYRYEPELRKSGIAVKWMVEDVPELDWLDAPSALHVLRILQESVSNTMGHSKATQLTFKCKMALLQGRPGLRVEIADNGSGFDINAPAIGRGRRNMVQRAEALGATLDVLSKQGEGTATILWLPLVRRHGLNLEEGQAAEQ